jgi:aryl-alcohol dehydrogenase-like predicted oxidoreductase
MGMSDFYGSKATRNAESIATIQAALDAGVTLFDTGDFYGSGRNELLQGREGSLGSGRGEDIVALIGMSKRARLSENLEALDVKVATRDLAELDALLAPGANAGERYDARQMQLVAR